MRIEVPAMSSRHAALVTFAILLAACSGPHPSHIADPYRGKLPDDTMFEASTTELVTTRDVVIALDCRPLHAAIAIDDTATLDRFVDAGAAAMLPEGVTLYTPPFSATNPRSAPFVVTDDRYGGTLCTPDSYNIIKQ